jgi:hypothetical protein
VNASTVIEDETSQAGIVETHETGWCHPRQVPSGRQRAGSRLQGWALLMGVALGSGAGRGVGFEVGVVGVGGD